MEHPAEHVEHVEHQQHAAHSPFDRKVAMTMAIVAALLAVDTLLSHRSHNETLRLQAEGVGLQAEAGGLQTKADIYHTEAAREWGYYQAKNIRKHEYTAFLEMAKFMAKDPAKEAEFKNATDYWRSQADKYETKDLPELEGKARAFDKEAKKFEEESLAKTKESETKVHESHLQHKRSTWFDIGELGLELALILCSIAILTKHAPFWYTGIVAGAIGVSIAAVGFFIQHH
jgi:Skp family chaperone for outer membrane proteins